MSARLSNLDHRDVEIAEQDHNGWLIFWALVLFVAWIVALIVLVLQAFKPNQGFGYLTALAFFSVLAFAQNFLLVSREEAARKDQLWGWGETIMSLCLAIVAVLLGWSSWRIFFTAPPLPVLVSVWSFIGLVLGVCGTVCWVIINPPRRETEKP